MNNPLRKRLLGVLVLLLGTASSAEDAYRSHEFELLKTISPTAISFLGEMSAPDENGHMGANHGGDWIEAGTQRGGCRSLIGAVIRGNRVQADDAWRSVETTFAHQLDDGGFELVPQAGDRSVVTPIARVETAFFFLQELGRALLIIEASPMADYFEARIEALKPKLRAATDFMQRGADAIVWKVGHTANRLLIAAKAFGLCGLVLEDDELKRTSTRLIEQALERRDKDGIFIEAGGRDSSYTAVSLLMGQVLLLYLPHPELEKAMEVNMAWLRTRIAEDGSVSTENNTRTGVGVEFGRNGRPKNVNTAEVAQALAYFGAIHDDPDARAMAEQVMIKRNAPRERQPKRAKRPTSAE